MTMVQERSQQPATMYCPDCGASETPLGRFCLPCGHLKGSAPNVKTATFAERLLAFVLDIVLIPLTLVIGYLIWWLIVLSNGQTPGKQLMGIRAVTATGEPLGWGMTFVREFLVKGIVIGVLSNFVFGIIFVINYLFPLFDQDNQALHDKMVSTVVVKGV